MDSTSSPSILFYSLHFPRAVSRFGNADPRICLGKPQRAFLAEAERLPVSREAGDGIVPAGALRGETRAAGAGAVTPGRPACEEGGGGGGDGAGGHGLSSDCPAVTAGGGTSRTLSACLIRIRQSARSRARHTTATAT